MSQLPLDMNAGVTVNVTMKGGNPVLKGVKVCGIEYSSKDILKIKVDATLGEYYNAMRDIKAAIDNWDYSD